MALAFGFVLVGALILAVTALGSNQAKATTTSAAATTGNQASAGVGAVVASADRRAVVDQAARKWSIPSWVLWGVYGAETDFGRLISTSSAGAIGSFQFIRSTAASYGYPYTNADDPATFAKQADSAAHLLHDLYNQTGSWESALQHYSGGGYGLAHVRGLASGGG